MRIRGVLETSLYTDDLHAAETFYTDVLGLEVFVKDEGRHVFFRCGNGMLLVFDPDASAGPAGEGGMDVPRHGAHGPGHMAFAIRADEVDVWRQCLVTAGVEIERDFTWPHGGHSLYFRDPAGNSLELATPALWGLTEDILP